MFSQLDVSDVVAEAKVKVVGGELADVNVKSDLVAIGVSDLEGEVVD